jgi:hypothetical protein
MVMSEQDRIRKKLDLMFWSELLEMQERNRLYPRVLVVGVLTAIPICITATLGVVNLLLSKRPRL